MIIDKIQSLASELRQFGLTSKSVEFSDISLSLDENPNLSEIGDDYVFERMITEREIYEVSRDLFLSQFYNNCVQEAFNALDKFVQRRAERMDVSGVALMRAVFNPKKPNIFLNNNQTQSEKDEFEGYGHILAGAMLGIRNPVTHEFQWIHDRETALECLILCQHLLRKIKAAK